MKNVTINKVELRGRIGTVRVQAIGDRLVANFSLCTEKHYQDKKGNNLIECCWHHVVVYDGEGINLEPDGKYDDRVLTAMWIA